MSTTSIRTVALFDHSLGGPEVISPEEANRRCPFLRTDVGRLRTFKVNRSVGTFTVKAHSAADAGSWANDQQHRILTEGKQ